MTSFKVLVTRQRAEVVTADYFVIVAGHLVFRNSPINRGYPETMRVFAPGAWREVKRTKP